jgi:hypothetical protein
MRYFHNFYGIFEVTDKIGLTIGFDFGAEQKSKGSSEYNNWYTPIVIVKVALNDQINVSVRGEYYSDANGVIIATGSPNGFRTFGYSANLDYQIQKNLLWRIEGRGFSSKDEIFILDNKPSKTNLFAITALMIQF